MCVTLWGCVYIYDIYVSRKFVFLKPLSSFSFKMKMNNHRNKEQHDQLLLQNFMQQLVQPINYHNNEWYLIGKGNYEQFLGKNPDPQVLGKHVRGPINVSGEYYVISIRKEAYINYLSQTDHQKCLVS